MERMNHAFEKRIVSASTSNRQGTLFLPTKSNSFKATIPAVWLGKIDVVKALSFFFGSRPLFIFS
jgi:hypothetical protein